MTDPNDLETPSEIGITLKGGNGKTHEFKGFVQPEVNQRLQQCKNFLADEDPDRCLHFEAKLTEIEEYVTHIRKSKEVNLVYDTKLLNDVHIMVKAHRDWQDRLLSYRGRLSMSRDSTNFTAVQPISNRFTSIESSLKVNQEKEEMGLTDQIREDHAVFSGDAGENHVEFLAQMRRDTGQDPMEIDIVQNIAWIESRAYSWALKDPALISHWMHLSKGLPNKGLLVLDDTPWYGMSTSAVSKSTKLRPAQGYLPEYLVKRKNRINSLLKLSSQTSEEYQELEMHLIYHAPDELRRKYKEYQDLKEDRAHGILKAEELLEEASEAFAKGFVKWISTFRTDGVQLMLRLPDAGLIESQEPGVFYIDDGSLANGRRSEVLHKANELLTKFRTTGEGSLTKNEVYVLDALLSFSAPGQIKYLEKHRFKQAERRASSKSFDNALYYNTKQESMDLQLEALKEERKRGILASQQLFWFPRPGEMFNPDSSESDLRLPWYMNVDKYPTMPSHPRPNLELTGTAAKIEGLVNRAFERGFPKKLEDGNPTLILLLQQVAYPYLRAALIPYLALRNLVGTPECSREEQRLFDAISPEVNRLWQNWIEGFSLSPSVNKIKVEMPCTVSGEPRHERPDVLYCRESKQDHQSLSCARAVEELNKLLEKNIASYNTMQYEQHFKDIESLFRQEWCFPALAQLRRANLDNYTSEGSAGQFYRFTQWMLSKSQLKLVTKFRNEFLDPEDDPTVVYFRGPLPTLRDLNLNLLDSDLEEIRRDPSEDMTQENLVIRRLEILRNMRPRLHSVLGEVLDYPSVDFVKDGQSPQGLVPHIINWYFHLTKKARLAIQEDPLDPMSCDLKVEVENEEDGVDDNCEVIGRITKRRVKLEQTYRHPENPRTPPLNSPHDMGGLISPPETPKTPIVRKIKGGVRKYDTGDTYTVNVDGEFIQMSIGKISKTIEVELKRLLGVLANPTTLKSQQILDSVSLEAIRFRLHRLLPQFMPSTTYEKWKRYVEYSDNLQVGNNNELLELLDDWREEVVPWCMKLDESQIVVLPPSATASSSVSTRGVFGDRGELLTTTLFFQEKEYSRNPGVITITAPYIAYQDKTGYEDENTVAHAPIKVLHLTKYIEPHPTMLPETVTIANDIEQKINALLKSRRNRLLTWEESEDLIEYCRWIMPMDLVHLDDALLAADNKARRGTFMTVEEVRRFWNLWEVWRDQFATWLKTLPPILKIAGGSAITTEDIATPSFTMNVLNSSQIHRLSRDRSLPSLVTDINDEIQRLLENPREITKLSRDAWTRLRTYLRPLHRETNAKFRKLLEHKIKKDFCPLMPLALAPEDRVLIEVSLDVAYMQFICALIAHSTPGSPILRMVEPVPGEFRMEYISTAPLESIKLDENELFNILWSDNQADHSLVMHKKRFHDLACSIRRNERISDHDTAFIKKQLNPVNKFDPFSTLLQLNELAANFNKPTDLSSQQRSRYISLETSLLWWRWAYDYPDIIEKVSPRQNLIDPVDDLMMRGWAGSVRRISPPLIAHPNNLEINELEVELNNLLQKYKNGSSNSRETCELNYILVALLPDRLRNDKGRIDYKEQRYLTQGGLNEQETLEFMSRERNYDQEFVNFKNGIPKYGIFLDSNWYAPAEIAEACSRARVWKNHTRDTNHMYNFPVTSNFVEDVNLRVWHKQYRELKSKVDEVWVGNDVLMRRFLWPEMPQEIRNLKIKLECTHPAGTTVNFGVEINPLLTKRDFVVRYMSWLVTLTAEEIRLKRDALGYHENDYDFTSKAERRGIQRASIEIALNTLATNQEQHRPGDRFRILNISGQQFHPPQEEVPITVALEPWKRPLEQEPFAYARKIAWYHQQKDLDYDIAREKTIERQVKFLEPPVNHLGPFALENEDSYRENARKRQAYLASIALLMQEAQLKAPRPLMQQLLFRFSDGLNYENGDRHPLYDKQPLTQNGLDVLVELSGDSWDEFKRDYTADFDDTTKSLLGEFEQEVNSLKDQIPFWKSSVEDVLVFKNAAAPLDMTAVKDVSRYEQVPYDEKDSPETQGISLVQLCNTLNAIRQTQSDLLFEWQVPEVRRLLGLMHDAFRIFYDQGTDRIWRLPLTGHPENKYVTKTPENGKKPPPGVRFTVTGVAEVIYDSTGTSGLPILQPRKYHYFQLLAYRLGRDSRTCLMIATSDYKPMKECLTEQLVGLRDSLQAMGDVTQNDRFQSILSNHETNSIDNKLQCLALEIHKVAPYLAEDATMKFPDGDIRKMNESQAAQILQMQIIEEISNNWELRFPENEHVWDFAQRRLDEVERTFGNRTKLIKPRIQRFFDLRRFPLSRQTPKIQRLIMNSGPVVQEKPVPPPDTKPPTRAELMRQGATSQKPPPKVERHIKGQRPYFPFGETPYQAAFQSFRISQDLANVPEFQTPKPSMVEKLVQFGKRKLGVGKLDNDGGIRTSRFNLPQVPVEWSPDSISKEAKTAAIVAIAKRTPGMPDPSILEHYHLQPEIDGLVRQENWLRHVQAVAIANETIKKLTGKSVSELTAVELHHARMDLSIDLTLGTFIPPNPQPNQENIKNHNQNNNGNGLLFGGGARKGFRAHRSGKTAPPGDSHQHNTHKFSGFDKAESQFVSPLVTEDHKVETGRGILRKRHPVEVEQRPEEPKRPKRK